VTMRILAVDDSKTMRNIVSFTLERAGYNVTVAADGVEALKCMDDGFDLIIADFNMPNMDGLELARRIKGHEQFKNTPILMLSTEFDDALKTRARDLGVTGWVKKPLVKSTFLELVNKVCAAHL